MTSKQCIQCNNIQPIENYRIRGKGRGTTCNTCETLKKCPRCNEIKPRTEFYKIKNTVRYICKTCDKEHSRNKYIKKNKKTTFQTLPPETRKNIINDISNGKNLTEIAYIYSIPYPVSWGLKNIVTYNNGTTANKKTAFQRLPIEKQKEIIRDVRTGEKLKTIALKHNIIYPALLSWGLKNLITD